MAFSIPGMFSRKYLLTGLGGMLFATLSWKISSLDFRYALAVTGSLVCLSLAMILVRHMEDFLVYALIFHIPFAIFGKWLFLQPVLVPAKGISLGLPELLLLIAYLHWFGRIFVTRSHPLPKMRPIDGWVLLLFAVFVVSGLLATNKTLALFDIIYTAKHMLIYFYLSHKIKKAHFRWILLLFLFAILLETGIAVFERTTGYVNIAGTKGNIQSEDFGVQYVVPGIENELRAAGTTNDSHTLGLYYAMLLPVPFILLASRRTGPWTKGLLALTGTLGLIGLIITFSRSGWLGFGVALLVACSVIVGKWRQIRTVGILLLVFFLASCFYPQAYGIIYRRIVEAPTVIMDARFEMHKTALDIWKHHPLLGAGPGNYIDALSLPDVQTSRALEGADLPVHNIYLYTLAELGALGALALALVVVSALCYCWRWAVQPGDDLTRCLALATLAGVMGYLANGMTDPMFREAVPYAQFWTFMALAAVFHDLPRPPIGEQARADGERILES